MLLLVTIFSVFLHVNIVPVYSKCVEDEQSSLLQLKQSLTFESFSSPTINSWSSSTDCCSWVGVTCNEGSVVSLDLSGQFISGGINNSSSLFELQHLESLNLAANRFSGTQIPSGIGKLTNLSYLNLSNAGFARQIPVEISRLTRLVTLDISTLYFTMIPLKLENPNLKMLVQNLSEIKELYLDGVNISAQGKEWCQAISSSLPNLRVLSMSDCYLQDCPDSSLLKLQSLSIIRLDYNPFFASVPEFFAYFTNLTSLHLSSCGLNGQFPEKIFQVPTLQTLDLSNNELLQGYWPEFHPNGSLRSLLLSGTKFSGTLPDSIGNLKMLSKIDLSFCNFSGSIPSSMKTLLNWFIWTFHQTTSTDQFHHSAGPRI